MRDDELLDEVLTDAMSAKAPELPDGFDQRVMQRVARPQLGGRDRVVMLMYAVAAMGATLWWMRDVPVDLAIPGVLAGMVMASACGLYARRLLAPSE